MMHHTQIAQRVFNTPLMVDPAKALAFVTGLGPRIVGRVVSIEVWLWIPRIRPLPPCQPGRRSLATT